MYGLYRFVIFCVLMISIAPSAARAQQSTADLSGRVTDSSGGVLPGASVTVTQTATGLQRTTVTDGSGTYLLPDLPTGPYRLEVMLSGFGTYVQTGIVLQVGASPTINATLGVGDLAETVTVEASTPLVDVRSAGISDVVENERIVELPLQGRQVTSLLILAGAAVDQQATSPRYNPGGVSISVGGGLAYGVAYSLDGAMHNDPYNNLNLPLPFPDALQEFSVATSGLSADNGMHSGASVNAVTKSGTNRLSGSGFEFVRDRRFNATNPFAAVGPDGKRTDDGLKRHQFGGTIGGPIVRDKLFFFGAYQGTRTRQAPTESIAWVPTAAMLAGDFTAFASPQCNAGRQITLRAPYVNNRIDPAQFSPAALKLAAMLPRTTDPCGQVTWGAQRDVNEWQAIGKADYQWRSNHTLFGRYMRTFVDELPVWAQGGNILATSTAGGDRTIIASSFTLGETAVLGPSMVNAIRVAYNGTSLNSVREPFVDAPSLGVNAFTYFPGKLTMTVTGGFNIGQADSIRSVLNTDAFQVADDLTLIRGRHQIAVGANFAYWTSDTELNARSGGLWQFNGSQTGLGLADFLAGRMFRLEQGAPNVLPIDQTYVGLYAQDAWSATSRVTVNAGVRWEPFMGQNVRSGAVSIFSMENFQRGIKSKVFRNAPAGLLYPGDDGFPDNNNAALNKQWGNLSPRVGVAWDVHGDGRLAVRTSYGLGYDFVSGQYHFLNAGAAPFANRLRVEGVPFDNPYVNTPGGNPFPIAPPSPDVAYPAFGSFGTLDPNAGSPRVQNWNVTVERQIVSDWQASVSYLGSYSDRLWNLVALNPGRYLGSGPCTIAGVAYPVCTTAANLDQRRVLYSQNPTEARLLGPVDRHTSIGTQDYRGLKLSFRRRAGAGVNVAGNYTLSRCYGNVTPTGQPQISSGFLKPEDPDFDRGNCEQNRTHVGNITAGYQTPHVSGPLGILASSWRVSGIVSARSGSWLTVTTGRDIAGTGISAQRLNQTMDDPYGAKTIGNYLNPSAFAYPSDGTLGDHQINSIEGPGYWTMDLALSRLLPFSDTRNVELRLEAFNLLNNFNWGNPVTVYDQATFGRIQTMAGNPRIMQFAVKVEF
jgi:hypothetical protein